VFNYQSNGEEPYQELPNKISSALHSNEVTVHIKILIPPSSWMYIYLKVIFECPSPYRKETGLHSSIFCCCLSSRNWAILREGYDWEGLGDQAKMNIVITFYHLLVEGQRGHCTVRIGKRTERWEFSFYLRII
jgi:hypothetical protein